MRPPEPIVFQTMAMDLMTRVIPAITPAYHQGTVGMIAAMLMMAGEEWDRAASRRIEENTRLREIFREASASVSDPALKARIAALAETRDDDFRISALENNNCALRAALIELHAHVELRTEPATRKIEETIWAELAKSTERRRFATAPF